jgi:hypothetical protein
MNDSHSTGITAELTMLRGQVLGLQQCIVALMADHFHHAGPDAERRAWQLFESARGTLGRTEEKLESSAGTANRYLSSQVLEIAHEQTHALQTLLARSLGR